MTATTAKWTVAVLMSNGCTAQRADSERFTTHAAAEREALRLHAQKPFMNFVAVAS